DDANFCGNCGTRLVPEVACPNCGRENPADLRFCPGCGAGLKEGTERAEPTEPTAAGSRAGAESNGAGAVEAPAEIAGGRYLIQDYLGEGGRKRVYRAHDASLDRDVAI